MVNHCRKKEAKEGRQEWANLVVLTQLSYSKVTQHWAWLHVSLVGQAHTAMIFGGGWSGRDWHEGLTLEQVSSNLNVDISTIWRVVKCFEETGTVSKKNNPTEGSAWPGKKSDKDCATHSSSCDSGDIYIQEIQSDVYEMTGIDVSPSLLCRFLKDANLSRQRMQMIARQRF